ncbi:hypothetical protein WISP_82054 [Willisornis vidua]|uniref:RGCC protein n=1 Tax=Willisornis vidua TaxID=1566151 RepID=A0ABQ9D5D9_9PASS|nr:hypothetical protein WISP_82054 [Willisornis vidua]
MAEELSDLLREFDEVMEDFDRGPACQYQQHLEELKRKAGHSVYDSGIDELESASTSPGSSLNSSEEHLNTPADTYPNKAKLGDTQELEEFIADLDKALEGLEALAMDQKGYRRGSFQSSTSDEDMLEIAGASVDLSMADDDPPLDREMGVLALSPGTKLCLSKASPRHTQNIDLSVVTTSTDLLGIHGLVQDKQN